ncbi:MAG: hypothetical protein OEO21_02540 [Candidatus Krumholzibacteria bacterium]|nr:hypothetical protein [Candidatus Krumholzibacteria bacterium]
MKHVVWVGLASLILISAVTAGGNPIIPPPINGTYFSFDLPGGSFNPGYFSESWVDPGTHGQIGNTVNAASWDGASLGAEWRLWCPSIGWPPELVSDTRDAEGTGEVTWRTRYNGGHFWLSMNGPWSFDGYLDFTGVLAGFIATTTYQYVDGAILGIRTNITLSGLFDNLGGNWTPRCMDYIISNAAFFGTTDTEIKPLDFPPFLDPDECPSDLPGLLRGGWGSVTEITLVIRDCYIVPTESTTWGHVKALYGDEQ